MGTFFCSKCQATANFGPSNDPFFGGRDARKAGWYVQQGFIFCPKCRAGEKAPDNSDIEGLVAN